MDAQGSSPGQKVRFRMRSHKAGRIEDRIRNDQDLWQLAPQGAGSGHWIRSKLFSNSADRAAALRQSQLRHSICDTRRWTRGLRGRVSRLCWRPVLLRNGNDKSVTLATDSAHRGYRLNMHNPKPMRHDREKSPSGTLGKRHTYGSLSSIVPPKKQCPRHYEYN
jgi:hypothetical protein